MRGRVAARAPMSWVLSVNNRLPIRRVVFAGSIRRVSAREPLLIVEILNLLVRVA